MTWKYCVGCLVMYFGDFVLSLLARGVSGEGAGVAGFWMYGDGMSCAVFGGLVTVMVSGVLISSVCCAGGEVSFSGAVGSWCAVGIELVVVGGRLTAVGWRGHSPAEGAGCLLLSVLLL